MNLFIRAAGFFLMVMSLGVAMVYRFSNPGLTETQLFLTLWPLTIVVLLALLAIALTSPKKPYRRL